MPTAFTTNRSRLGQGTGAEEQVTLVIQINGKVRDKVEVPASISEPEARDLACRNRGYGPS